jgi:hypothetical protein
MFNLIERFFLLKIYQLVEKFRLKKSFTHLPFIFI